MQFTQKHIIGIIISGLVLVGGYFAVQNNTPSQSDGVNTISQSGIETDTGKRLETVANSGTQWGMSPFGSGKPLTEEEKKPEFKKPNTEWKTRTLNGITYVFGEGNPTGIAMTLDQIDAMTKTCENNVGLAEKGICNIESGLMSYVTPEVEKYLLLALSDPNWSKLATECEKNFRFLEGMDSYGNAKNDPTYLIFDRVFAPGFLDIDRFMSVEPATGLKILNTGLTIGLPNFLMRAMLDGQAEADGSKNPYGDCVDQYGKSIVRNLVIATNLYMAPLGSSK